MCEIYNSILNEASVQNKIEGSRFIAEVFPIVEEESAKCRIEMVRKMYHDATHHCFAYIIGNKKKIYHYSDDGEPSSTAGVKIYNAINTKNISDVLLVVTRYYGGTKLGIGGLGRAYMESSLAVLEKTTIITKAMVNEVNLIFPFSESKFVMKLINAEKIKIVGTNYLDSGLSLIIQILPSKIDTFKIHLNNVTKGRAQLKLGILKTVIIR